MSILENLLAALEANTESNVALTAAIEAGNASRDKVLAVAEGAAAKAKPAAKAKATETPAAEDESDETPPKTEAAKPKSDAPTGDVPAAVVAYIGDTEGPEREARKGEVAKLFEKVGAKKASEVPADKVKAVLKALATLTERGDVLPAETSEEDEEESLID